MIQIEVRGLIDVKNWVNSDNYRMMRVGQVTEAYGNLALSAFRYASPVGDRTRQHSPGQFKSSWNSRVYRGLKAIIEYHITNDLIYAPYVVYGSKIGEPPWKGIGPRTTVFRDRIFPRQTGQSMFDIVVTDQAVNALVMRIGDAAVT